MYLLLYLVFILSVVLSSATFRLHTDSSLKYNKAVLLFFFSWFFLTQYVLIIHNHSLSLLLSYDMLSYDTRWVFLLYFTSTKRESWTYNFYALYNIFCMYMYIYIYIYYIVDILILHQQYRIYTPIQFRIISYLSIFTPNNFTSCCN